MLNNLRWWLAAILIEKADANFRKKTLESMLKGMKYFLWTIRIAPPNDEFDRLVDQLNDDVLKAFQQ